jgi:ABC-type nitrate/sulfonate/bicarbonate transport system substrate-binding protein
MSRQQLPLLIHDSMEGARFVGVSIVAANPVYYLVARPEIRTFDDLKGKAVTITNLHDGITIWTRQLIAQHGIARDEIALKTIAGSDGRLACLKSGECAAASLAQPAAFDAVAEGFHVLGITNEISERLYQVDIVDPAWARAHRELVIKYIRANTEALRFIQDPKNRDEVLAITKDFMGETEDHARQMLATIWDPANRVLPEAPAFDMAEIGAVIALLGEYDALEKPLPAPERFIDPSYAAAAGP